VIPLLAGWFMFGTFPAEWEPQESVWMSWATYDNKRGHSVHAVQREMIHALGPETKVDLLVRPNQLAQATKFLGKTSYVRFHLSGNNEIWTRDFGPIFVKNPNGTLQPVTYKFNYWGYTDLNDQMSKAEDMVDAQFGLNAVRGTSTMLLNAPIISEGGNREFNGKGTMIVVESVEKHRNPGKLREELETEHKRYLGVDRVIWLPHGGLEDDLTFMGPLDGGKEGDVYTVIATGGHVDNVARFVNVNTVLLAEVTLEDAKKSPIAWASRNRLEENARTLRRAAPDLKIIRMPVPDPMITTMSPGDGVYDYIKDLNYAKKPFPKGKPIKVIQAASYLNFLISNGKIITSKFYKPGRPVGLKAKDAKALQILKEAFPGYKIIAIDSEAINLGGGGIHCITQQMPTSKK
jgi:agmatine deiminase